MPYLILTYLSYSCALDLEQHVKQLTPKFSPSELVHSADKLASVLGGEEHLIHMGRPGGPPAALFNPALATLQRNLEDLESVEVSRLEVERAARYLQCTVRFYKDEAHRQNEIKDSINQAIGEDGAWGRVLNWADNI